MTEAVVTATPAAPPPPAPSAAPSAPAKPAEGGPAAKTDAAPALATPPGETTPDTPDQAEKRGKSRFERKISRLYREAAEARAERDLYKKQLDEAKPKPVEDAGTPKLEQFKDIEEYATAKAKYEADKALKAHEAKQSSETQRQATARLTEQWQEKAERADSKYDDFDEVVGDLKPTSPWAIAIMESENGEDIAYHLGQNMKEAQRIASLPAVSQIREIGRLEAKLLAAPPPQKQPSKAPAPITPLTGTSTAESATPSDTDDISTWMKKRQAQVHGKRR